MYVYICGGLDNALVVIRQQYILILAYVFTYVYIKFASKFMTEALGVFRGITVLFECNDSVF